MDRKLRIAVSVFFGLMTVVLVVLWVRSRTTVDVIGIRPTAECWIAITSSASEFEFTVLTGGPFGAADDWYGFYSSDLTKTVGPDVPQRRPRFKLQRTAHELRITMPIFVLMAASVLAMGAPWMPWRFSLRTLLIATALVAVVLGLAVWAGGEDFAVLEGLRR